MVRPQENPKKTLAIGVDDVIEVPVKEVLEGSSDYGKFITVMIQKRIKPKMKERGLEKFKVALIEMFDSSEFPDRPYEVHFDDEVIYELEVEGQKFSQDSVGKTAKELGVDILADRKKMVPVPHNEHSGHVAIARFNDVFLLYYNFRYNRPKAKQKLDRAREFLSALNSLDPNSHENVINYLVWSAMELIVDAVLLLIPMVEKDRAQQNLHKERMRRLLEMQSEITALSEEFVTTFQQVSSAKNAARYADKPVPLSREELIKAVETLSQELADNRVLGE